MGPRQAAEIGQQPAESNHPNEARGEPDMGHGGGAGITPTRTTWYRPHDTPQPEMMAGEKIQSREDSSVQNFPPPSIPGANLPAGKDDEVDMVTSTPRGRRQTQGGGGG